MAMPSPRQASTRARLQQRASRKQNLLLASALSRGVMVQALSDIDQRAGNGLLLANRARLALGSPGGQALLSGLRALGTGLLMRSRRQLQGPLKALRWLQWLWQAWSSRG